jgi:hypothetical protein
MARTIPVTMAGVAAMIAHARQAIETDREVDWRDWVPTVLKTVSRASKIGVAKYETNFNRGVRGAYDRDAGDGGPGLVRRRGCGKKYLPKRDADNPASRLMIGLGHGVKGSCAMSMSTMVLANMAVAKFTPTPLRAFTASSSAA